MDNESIDTIEFDAIIPDSATAISVGPKGCKLKLDIPAREREAYFRLMEVGFDRGLRVKIEIRPEGAQAPDPDQPQLIEGYVEEPEEQAEDGDGPPEHPEGHVGRWLKVRIPPEGEGADDAREQEGDPEQDEREMLSNPGPGEE